MYYYSKSSLKKIKDLHPDWQIILNEAIQIYDNTVVWGYRGEKKQNEFYKNGTSQLKYPKSKHNKKPSKAVDLDPYPLDRDILSKKWSEIKDNPLLIKSYFKEIHKYYHLAGIIKAIAFKHNIKIRWGGDWDRDNDFDDNLFDDLAHFELVDK